jgi:hypothetical protein
LGPGAGLDTMEAGRISYSSRESNPGRPDPSLSLYQDVAASEILASVSKFIMKYSPHASLTQGSVSYVSEIRV